MSPASHVSPTSPAAASAAFTVVIDSREQRPFAIPGAVVAKLDSGDYSVAGLEDQIAIERKSPSDLFGTVGHGRDRFERELIRLSALRYSAIVIEGDLGQLFAAPPRHTKMRPAAVFASLCAWSVRYGVHVWFASSRAHACAVTLHLLEKFWKEAQKRALSGASA